ncbi:MAG: phosphoenolpyruvate--protein phosphotransferase, partial [Verrucomicrobia bacterium]
MSPIPKQLFRCALTSKNIQLGTKIASKQAAIEEAGRVLASLGCIESGYIRSMFEREKMETTYLGKGIAIPHGLPKDRALVHQTGISVVQIPAGVCWGPGQIAYLIVGIAAKSDEHVSILAAVAEICNDSGAISRLARTDDVEEIIYALTTQQHSRPNIEEEKIDTEAIEVVVPKQITLHLQPATIFSKVALTFTSKIRVWYGDKCADGQSVTSLLKLGIHGGTPIRITADGPDAAAALNALRATVEYKLSLGEESKLPIFEAECWKPVLHDWIISGISASNGLAIGPLIYYRPEELVVTDTPQGTHKEKEALQHAVGKVKIQLRQQISQKESQIEATIFRTHLALLNDRELLNKVFQKISDGHSAAWAWNSVITQCITEFSQIENKYLAERAADLNDIRQRVLQLLLGTERRVIPVPGESSVLIAHHLLVSDMACLDSKHIIAICTAEGTPTTHAAIIARSLGIPAIVGAGSAVLDLLPGTICIADGSAGKLYIKPNEETLASARQYQMGLKGQQKEEYQARYHPAVMRDGYRIKVVANIGKPNETIGAIEAGAEGIGLMRTEFLFIDGPPSADEQYAAYTTMLHALDGLPLTLRTIDIGGDKVPSYISTPKEGNLFLGMRGVRLCLQQPEIFLPQLHAIYRASLIGPVRMMFPMVTTLEDFRAAKELAEGVRQKVGAPPIEIGVMFEVPSVIFLASEFAQEADFLSIGTNDLVQYAFARDRLHASSVQNVDGLHPAVLRMVAMTVRAARA